MSRDDSFHEYVLRDLLRGIPGIASRAMFGGWGIYKNGIIFAIIADGELYFKVDETNRPDFERMGSHPFAYIQGKQQSTTMSYWTLPESVGDNQSELAQWVDRAVAAGLRSRKVGGKNRRRAR